MMCNVKMESKGDQQDLEGCTDYRRCYMEDGNGDDYIQYILIIKIVI